MRHLLTDYDNKKVEAFIVYVTSLKYAENHQWSKSVSDESFANVFKKEAAKGLYIDGETITLQWRGGKSNKMVVSYDYHAYKNKVAAAYPESVFDFDIVYEGDEFFFSKEDGKVVYKHELNNPFDSNKKVKGAYGIIKNKRGEFIELLTPADIAKMKAVSKMQGVWDTWHDRMVKKSIIKRICSVAFHDITEELDKVDNENYNPAYADLENELAEQIKNAKTEVELTEIYLANIKKNINRKSFIKAISDRKKEVLNVKIDQ